MDGPRYRLYYWPDIPGRGEFVRLAFEAVGAEYEEVVQHWDALSAPMLELDGQTLPRPPMAPPFLEVDGEIIGQTANILAFLGPRLGLVPDGNAERRWVNQLQLTIMDWAEEIHGTHHPVAPELYYEDQQSEARRRAGEYLKRRQPKYLAYFEHVLALGAGSWLVGDRLSYVDLSLFFMLRGLAFAFPAAMSGSAEHYPLLSGLDARVGSLDRIERYWSSSRRRKFKDGLFRYYPELDAGGN